MFKLILLNLCILFTLSLSQTQTCNNPFNVGTFNTLQIFFAPFKDERLDETIEYLRDDLTDLSVLCLQELWDTDQRNRVISQLSSRYPHSLAAAGLPQNQCSGGCGSDEIRAIKDCLSSFECLDFTDSTSFSDCVRLNCRETIEGLGAECTTCLQQGDSVGDIFRNVDNCFSNDNTETNNGTCYAFNAQSDNVLLSKIPFDETDVLYFTNSPITLTTALYGKIQVPNVGTAHVFCTHLLPADLPVFTFEEEVNFNQTKELLAWVESKLGSSSTNNSTVGNSTASTEPVIILGDFNHGPSGYFPANYDFIINSGYSSAYIDNGNRNCTYCRSNPLTYGTTTLIIDHVYLKNAFSTTSNRFGTYWDESVDINHEIIGITIGSDEVTLSDHYGVRSTICSGQTPQGTTSGSVAVVDNDVFPGSDNSGVTFFVSFATLFIVALIL